MPYNQPAPTLDDFKIIDRWLLFRISGKLRDLLREDQSTFKARGDYFIGFAYVDPTAGITIAPEIFCELVDGGDQVVTWGQSYTANKSMVRLRYGSYNDMQFWLLKKDHIKALKLPEQPDWLEFYKQPEVEPTRQIEALKPLRAPGFPDDIKFLLMPPEGSGMQMEEIWGRIVRRRDERPNDIFLECVLLNKPYQDFGVKAGDHVVVQILPGQDAVMAICVAHM